MTSTEIIYLSDLGPGVRVYCDCHNDTELLLLAFLASEALFEMPNIPHLDFKYSLIHSGGAFRIFFFELNSISL